MSASTEPARTGLTSVLSAQKKRAELHTGWAGLLLMVAAVSAISAMDPAGVSLRIGMIMVTVGASMWLTREQLAGVVVLTWIMPNLGRNLVEDYALFSSAMMLELPGLAALAFFASAARDSLRSLEDENVAIGSSKDKAAWSNYETGIYESALLVPSLASELARSRRFGHTFALVLVGVDGKRQRFDYRDEADWQASVVATQRLLGQTRNNVDKVFHYGNGLYAMLLPESSEEDVPGLVRRLRRIARKTKPSEGEPGGPLPVHFGATFFPECATTVDDLLRRAEIALKLAEKSTSRYQLDGAEAPELPPAESMRRDSAEEAAILAVSDPRIVATEAPLVENATPAGWAEGADEADAGFEEPQVVTDAPPVAGPDLATPGQAKMDDLAAMLEQMNGTLELIRSARSRG